MSLDLDRSTWQRVKFGDVVRHCKESTDPEADGVERYVAGEHMDTDNLKITRWGEVGDGYLGPAFHRKFEAGQVLYGSRRTYLRKVAVADFDGVCANTTFVLESADPAVLLPELLPFIMSTERFHAHSIAESKGSVNPYVNLTDIAKYEFDLPPISEQMKITRLFWNAEWHKRALAQLRDKVDLSFQSQVDDILHAASNDRPIATLEEYASINPRVEGVTEKSPFVEMADVSEWGTWVRGSSEKGSRSGARAEAGDFLVARISPCLENGKIARLDLDSPPTGGSTEFLVVRAKSGVNPDTMAGLLRNYSLHQMMVHFMSGTTGRQRLDAKSLRSLPVPSLSDGEMDAIARAWRAMNTALNSLKDEEHRLATLVKTLLGEIL